MSTSILGGVVIDRTKGMLRLLKRHPNIRAFNGEGSSVSLSNPGKYNYYMVSPGARTLLMEKGEHCTQSSKLPAIWVTSVPSDEIVTYMYATLGIPLVLAKIRRSDAKE